MRRHVAIRWQSSIIVGIVLLVANRDRSVFAADPPPKSLDPRIKIELFAEDPVIATPTGIDVDHAGRVWVIESNTHFPPEGYDRHPTDRVHVLIDKNGDGKADDDVIFTDGLKFTMSVAVKPPWFMPGFAKAAEDGESKIEDGDAKPNRKTEIQHRESLSSVYLATRAEIFLFHDDDGDLKADRGESIVRLETKGNYPHNGLAGIAFDPIGWMFFGFGENLGEPYKIIGSDGTTLSGGGEGGNLYRCRLDGSKLERWATGFWNPHASCFDAFGRLFTVDNDPDSRPPCRLLHVIPGGDYGFRFRNGRKGLHPFTSWNGEIPGTLPMVAGTGEAPSGILAYESDGFSFAAEETDASGKATTPPSSGSSNKPPPAAEEYIGNLLVTSWGDHRIDRFRLKPKGASFESLAEPLIVGGENFRPVGIACAPDGSLFVSDWVLRDYKLHGKGRVWRIAAVETPSRDVLDVVQIAVPKSQGELLKLLNNRRLDVRRAAAKAAIAGDHWDWCRTIASGEIDAQRSDGRVLSELMNYDPDGFDPGGKEAGSSWASLSADQRWCRVSTLFGSRSEDPYLQTRANWCLGRGEVSEAWILKRLVNPIVTCDEFNSTGPISLDWASRTLLFAARSRIPRSTAVVHRLLDNTSPVIRRLVLQWVAEEGLTEFRPQVEAILNDPGITSDLFLATLAALEMLDGVPPQEFDKTPARKYVVPLLRDANRPAAVRSQALRLVAANDPALDARLLGELMASSHPDLRRETVRTLQFKSPAPDNSVEQASRLLLSVLHSTTDPVSLKADALVSLSAHARGPKPNADSLAALRSAALSLNATLRREGLRGLRGLGADDDETRKTLASLANTLALIKQPQSSHRELAEQLALTLGDGAASLPKEVLALRPKRPTSVEEWKATLSTADNSSPRPTEGEGPGVRGPGDAGRETQGKSSQQSHRRDAGATDQGKPAATPTPHPNPLPQGQRRHAHGESEPVAAGRRTFFHPNSAGCFKCHTVNGRGGNVGPDLSTIARSMSRDKLIESILEPSREVAPQFTTWTMETADGQVHSGMIVHENEGKTVLGDAEAKLTELKTIDIVARTPQRQSVMPDKLADRLTVREFRDLLAFLESLK